MASTVICMHLVSKTLFSKVIRSKSSDRVAWASDSQEIRVTGISLACRRLRLLMRFYVFHAGLCILFEENPVWCQLVQIVHSVLSVSVVIYFYVRVGGKIKLFVENLITSLPISRERGDSKMLYSMVMSSLFLILGLTLCIPLRNLYLTGLVHQEDQIIEQISHQVIQNKTTVYYCINLDWFLVFHFSSLNMGFLLSFSYFFATAIEELKQKFMIENQKELIIVWLKHIII